MDLIEYHRSIAAEMNAVKDRIRHLMPEPHWLTDGEGKEAVLRYILRRHLPERFKVGRGFIITEQTCSSQIDILIYDSSAATIFKDGDLVFAGPDAARAIIEVKSKMTDGNLPEVIDKLIANLELVFNQRMPRGLPRRHRDLFVGAFSYESDLHVDVALNLLHDKSRGRLEKVVNHLCLDSSTFVKFWNGLGGVNEQPEWRAYEINSLAPAYFIGNLVDSLAHDSVYPNQRLWFPLESKEVHKTGSRPLSRQG